MTAATAFRDIPAASFPFTVEYLRADTQVVVRRDVVKAPGVLRVPPVSKDEGVPIGVRVTYATGEVVEYWPNEEGPGDG